MEAYTIDEAKQEIKASIAVYLQKDENGKYVMEEVNRLPFYLQGEPGIGKTEMARQIAEELGIGFVSLSITHHTRNTVLGLPVIRELHDKKETKYTSYTMSEMIAMVEKKVKEGYSEGILLVDEFACMAESMVAPMLAFLQNKNIGTHKLPEGWVLLLSSNPVAYNKSAREFDMAVMDRVRLMDISFNVEELLRYGRQNRFDKDILEYLNLYPLDAHACAVTESGEKIIVTGRGWENLSHCIIGYKKMGQKITEKLIRQFIKSDEVANRFYRFLLTCQSGLDSERVKDILSGKNLSRHIDAMKDRAYHERFMTMMLIADILTKNSAPVEKERDFVCFLFAFIKIAEQNMGFVENVINERISGDPQPLEYPNRKLDDREREAWKYIKKMSEDRSMELPEATYLYIRQINDGLRERQLKTSDYFSNACRFLAAVEGEDSLVSPFINMLNKCKGFLDVMTMIKNPEWMKYNGKALGMDTFRSRLAGQSKA